MGREVASVMIHCGWEPEPEVNPGYELLCLRPEIHVDQEGTVSPTTVAVYPFLWEGRVRSVLPVNSETGARHYVIRRMGAALAVPAVSVTASAMLAFGGGRFDLVAKEDVTEKKVGNLTNYTYADTAVLACAYIHVTRDGTDAGRRIPPS